MPYKSEVKIAIADTICIPLVVKQVAPSAAWRDRAVIRGYQCKSNEGAAFLADPVFCIPWIEDHGPLRIVYSGTDEVGTLVMMRSDGRPLEHRLIRGLTAYLKGKIDQADAPLKPRDRPRVWLQHVLAKVTKEDFEKWYATSKEEENDM